MDGSAVKVGRNASKKSDIVRHLRQQIVVGELAPGSRLPTRSDLEEQFQSSPVTVQSALDYLVKDGFIRVHGRRATFVADYLPHLTRYGVVLPGHPLQSMHWSRFFAAIGNEAMRLQAEGPVQFPLYYNITDQEKGEDYERLRHDIQSHRLAGLIFVAQSFATAEKPLVAESGVPMVSVVESRETDLPRVRLDRYSFIDKALDHFAACGRKKVALMATFGWLERDNEYFMEALAQRGLSTREQWLQSFLQGGSGPVRNCANLLWRSRALESFDAVLIADDNLVEQCAAGFLASGSYAADEVTIVSHCNFPSQETNLLGARRLGFDSRQLLRACVASIDSQREGQETPRNTFVPAVFEDELNS